MPGKKRVIIFCVQYSAILKFLFLFYSPEKSHELAQALTSDSHAGKGVEMFHRRRQKADDWVVDENKIRNTSRSLPPVAPRRHLVDPADVIG